MVALLYYKHFTMTHTYNIEGMTCGNCVTKVKSALLKIVDVAEADLQLAAPQARIRMQQHIPVQTLQSAIDKAGHYTIKEADGGMHVVPEEAVAKSWWQTYKPVLLIGLFITGITLLIQLQSGGFDGVQWMRHFMAAFFIVFSFFKLLDVKAFAESYAMYDVVAKRVPAWGYVYPFVELALGIAFLMNIQPLLVNSITLVVMAISIIGVLQTVLQKKIIRCACLGAVFNLPMSSITIIEDAFMLFMSGLMLAQWM